LGIYDNILLTNMEMQVVDITEAVKVQNSSLKILEGSIDHS